MDRSIHWLNKNLTITNILKFIRELFVLDLRALALMRISLGLILLLDLINRARDLRFFYTDSGPFPIEFMDSTRSYPYFSFHMLSGDTLFISVLFLLAGVFALMMIFGYKSRVATVLSWILLLSLHNRNFIVLQGGDGFLRVAMFWVMFLPLGQVWSLDSYLSRGSAKYEDRYLGIAGFGFMLQLFVLYVVTAQLKTSPDWRVDFTATQYALMIDQFTNWFGYVLLHFPDFLKVVTFATLYFEMFGVLFYFVPWKRDVFKLATVVSFVVFHIGLGISMHLGFFPWIMCAAWIGLLPEGFMDYVEESRWVQKYFRWISGLESRIVGGGEILDEGILKKIWTILQPLRTYISLLFLSTVIIITLIWNFNTITEDDIEIPQYIEKSYRFLRLDQHWNMFAPGPLKNDGWYIIEAHYSDGHSWDIFQDQAITLEKPDKVADMYKTQRWRKYMMNLANNQYGIHRTKLLEYYCSTDDEMRKVQLHFISERSDLLFYPTHQKQTLVEIECD